MNIKNHIIGVATVFFLVPQLALADELKLEILMCAKTEDGVERFSCYEAIGKKLLAVEEGEKNEVEVVASNTKIEPLADPKLNTTPDTVVEDEVASSDVVVEKTLSDELGGRQFKKEESGSEKRSQILATARVTSCRKAVDGKWFFFFENGQVWKQVDSSRRHYRSCDFMANIKKDGIGFKIQVEGEKRSTRVKRHR